MASGTRFQPDASEAQRPAEVGLRRLSILVRPMVMAAKPSLPTLAATFLNSLDRVTNALLDPVGTARDIRHIRNGLSVVDAVQLFQDQVLCSRRSNPTTGSIVVC